MPEEPLEAAAYWVMRLESHQCGPADRAAFAAWRAERPEHAQAFAQVCRALGTVDRHLTDSRLIELGEEAYRSAVLPQRSLWRRTAAGLAAACVLAIGASIYWPEPSQTDPAPQQVADTRALPVNTYQTRFGERSTITLSDESIVTLNSDSLVTVHFTGSSRIRRLRLERGQAMFEVAKDGRPFEVLAGDRRVVALGTAFDVRLEAKTQGVRVTLIEGLVDVDVQHARGRDASAGNSTALEQMSPTRLEPGQQLIATPKERPVVIQADMERATGWRDGRMVFRRDPLPVVLEEVNRYSQRKIVAGRQKELESIRISGVFFAGSTRAFLQAVEAAYPVKAHTVAYDRVELVWTGEGTSFAESQAEDETHAGKASDGMREAELDASDAPEDRLN